MAEGFSRYTFQFPFNLNCSLCNFLPSSRTSLITHMSSTHNFNKISFHCTLCGDKDYDKISSMSSHYTKCQNKIKGLHLMGNPSSTGASNVNTSSAGGGDVLVGRRPNIIQPDIPATRYVHCTVCALPFLKQVELSNHMRLKHPMEYDSLNIPSRGSAWPDSELNAMASMEADILSLSEGPIHNINMRLCSLLKSRTLQGIKGARRLQRYRNFLVVALRRNGRDPDEFIPTSNEAMGTNTRCTRVLMGASNVTNIITTQVNTTQIDALPILVDTTHINNIADDCSDNCIEDVEHSLHSYIGDLSNQEINPPDYNMLNDSVIHTNHEESLKTRFLESIVSLQLPANLKMSISSDTMSVDIYNQIVNGFVHEIVPLRTTSSNNNNDTTRNTLTTQGLSARRRKQMVYSRTQWLYRKSPKSAYEFIMQGEGTNTVPADDIANVFDPIFMAKSLNPKCPLPAAPCVGEGIEIISPAEVKKALASMNSKVSPGLDGLTVGQLRGIPQGVIAAIFNNWLVFGKIPTNMKNLKTTFIPKVKSPRNGHDFRPITIAPIIYRLFSKIINTRFQGIFPINKWQAGFCLDNSAATNVHVLQALMQQQKKRRKGLNICTIDVSKAFDSISHNSIFEALDSRGCPAVYKEIIKDSYTNCSTIYTNSGFNRDHTVHLNRGIKQGDPLSPFLFNLVMNPLIERLNQRIGATLDVGLSISVLAYADDLILISDSKNGLQLLISEVTSFLDNHWMKVNENKCDYFGWVYVGRTKKFKFGLPPVSINGNEVNSIPPNQAIRFLGIKFFCNKPPSFPLDLLKEEISLIKKARLKPLQKHHILLSIVVPKYTFLASSLNCPFTAALGFDKVLRRTIKEIFHLPMSFPNILLRADWRNGGIGAPDLEHRILSIYCGDIARMFRLNIPAINFLLDYNPFQKFFTKAYLRLGIDYVVTEKKDLNGLCNRNKQDRLNHSFGTYVNKDLTTFRSNPISNKWLSPTSNLISFRDRVNALRLRANLVKTRALFNKGSVNQADRLCRRCNVAIETPCHILQMCPFVKDSRIKRHDIIAKNIAKYFSKILPGSEVQLERTHVNSDGARQRPDLTIITPQKTYLIEVAVTWEGAGDSLDNMYAAKYAKYSNLLNKFKLKGEAVLLPVIVGARGLLCSKSINGLVKEGLTKKDLEFISADALVGSLVVISRFMAL